MAFALAKKNRVFIDRMIRMGEFNNQSKVVREAPRRMEREENRAELMRLPPAERRNILASQARQAEALYGENPEMIMEESEAPLSYD